MKTLWTILNDIGHGKTILCQCKCGTVKHVDRYSVKTELSKSCGCLRKQLNTKGNRQTRAYSIWQNMKARCSNPNNPKYEYYGAKGIAVCSRWEDFDKFFEDMGEPSSQFTLERIDSTKGYSLNNCKWASRLEQQQNISSNHNISYKGKTLCIAAWSRELKIIETTLRNRIRRGWPVERAFNPTLRQGTKCNT